MKKLSTLLFIILISNLVACQTSEYPELVDRKVMEYTDNPEYFEKQYNNEGTKEFFSFYKGIYEFTTTKNSDLKSKTDIDTTSFPWHYKVTNLEANKILENIDDSIYATKNGYASYSNSATTEIKIISHNVLKFNSREMQEFKSTSRLKRTPNALNNITYKYLDYNLKNEKGDIVNIEQEYLGICSQGMSKKEGSYYHGFCMFNQSLKPEYTKLFGYIDLEVQIPIDYEIKMITKKDLGKIFYMGKNKIKILEFDANAFHYQIIEKGEKFETRFSSTNSSELILPFDFYTKLRQNQGLDFEEIIERKYFFELDKEPLDYEEEVFVSKIDDFALDFVYFYIPKYVSRKIKVLVNIN